MPLPRKKTINKPTLSSEPTVFLERKGQERGGNAKSKVTSPAYNYDMLRDGVTFSMLDSFLQCPEKHKLRAVEGLSHKTQSDALQFGNIFHNAHDVLYTMASEGTLKVGCLEETIDDIMIKMYDRDIAKLRKNLAGAQSEEAYEMVHSMVWPVIQAYAQNWKTDFTTFKWLGLEEVFDIPYELLLPEGRGGKVTIRLRGKRDGRYESRGKMYLFETKTKSHTEDPAIVDKMAWDLQVMIYSLVMWKQFGQAPAGVLYNLVRRPQLRQGAKETYQNFIQRITDDIEKRPEHYFYRLNVALTKKDILDWEPTFQSMLLQMYRWHQGEFHYRNSGQCKGQYGPCEFLNVCSTNDRSRFTQRLVVFPELEDT